MNEFLCLLFRTHSYRNVFEILGGEEVIDWECIYCGRTYQGRHDER